MKTCTIYMGRFQPFHKGHQAALKKVKGEKVLVIVRGRLSKVKDNPIPVEMQINMINKVVDIPVEVFGSGYLPDVIEMVRSKLSLDPKKVICGEDRIKQYKAQIDRANKTLEAPLAIEFVVADRITSATKVREAIRSGDEKAFKANVPKQLWDEFTNLQAIM